VETAPPTKPAVLGGRSPRGPLLPRTSLDSDAGGATDWGRAAALRLAVVIASSVTSDAAEKVPTGGELTLFEAVGPGRA
jgi:hypothetical protein